MRKANFAKIKEFIERLNKKFDVASDKTRIALLQFGEPVKTRIEFNLGEKNTLDEVNKGVTDMKYLRSQTATADALRKAREKVMKLRLSPRASSAYSFERCIFFGRRFVQNFVGGSDFCQDFCPRSISRSRFTIHMNSNSCCDVKKNT